MLGIYAGWHLWMVARAHQPRRPQKQSYRQVDCQRRRRSPRRTEPQACRLHHRNVQQALVCTSSGALLLFSIRSSVQVAHARASLPRVPVKQRGIKTVVPCAATIRLYVFRLFIVKNLADDLHARLSPADGTNSAKFTAPPLCSPQHRHRVRQWHPVASEEQGQ